MQRKLFRKAAAGSRAESACDRIGQTVFPPDTGRLGLPPDTDRLSLPPDTDRLGLQMSRSWRGRPSRCRSSLPRLLARRSRYASAREKMGSWPGRRCSGGPAVAPKVGVWGLLLATALRLELTGGPGARRRRSGCQGEMPGTRRRPFRRQLIYVDQEMTGGDFVRL